MSEEREVPPEKPQPTVQLTKAANVWVDRELELRQHVTGRFAGTVIGIQETAAKGRAIRRHVIEVLDLDLD